MDFLSIILIKRRKKKKKEERDRYSNVCMEIEICAGENSEYERSGRDRRKAIERE